MHAHIVLALSWQNRRNYYKVKEEKSINFEATDFWPVFTKNVKICLSVSMFGTNFSKHPVHTEIDKSVGTLDEKLSVL